MNKIKEHDTDFVDTKDRDSIKENMVFMNLVDGKDIFEDTTYDIRNRRCEVFEVWTDTTISLYINKIFIGTRYTL